MILALALGLILLGVLVGARGMRRLGASLRGPWKPGVAGLGLLALLGALLTGVRGEWWAAGALAFLAAGCVGATRRARPPRPSPAGMSKAEAADLLGVAVDAPAPEVEAAFRRLVLKLHPDQGGTAGLTGKLQEARSVLRGR